MSTIQQRRIRLQERVVHYTVRRHPKARHMRLTVSPHDGVVVTLPLRLPRYLNVDRFVRDNGDWLLERLDRLGHLEEPQQTRRDLRSGDKVPFRGRIRRLRIHDSRPGDERIRITDSGEILEVLTSDRSSTREQIVDWMKERARVELRKVSEREAGRLGLRYGRLTVRDQKTKWGSCSRRGNLSFNWRLILFPPEVLRYIVIHELCHLVHFDHSPRFWKKLDRSLPNWESQQEWLKIEGVRAENLRF